MDRRHTVRVFRSRLLEAMNQAELNRSQLAEKAGVDRSTLSQLLAPDNIRLPRADTVAAIASVLQVSLDWLLGLSRDAALGAAILDESIQVTPRPRGSADENLARWHEAAVGYKIRYVPTTLPDLVKTDEVIRHEFRDYAAKTPDQAIAASQGRLAYTKLPETDMEICLSQQALEGFARGEGIWQGLALSARREQLERMAALLDELYPSLRLFLFDGLVNYSVPYTIFGPLRAVVYMGQLYFVFNTTAHIRILARHFDDLIRAAVVQSAEMPAYLRRLLTELNSG